MNTPSSTLAAEPAPRPPVERHPLLRRIRQAAARNLRPALAIWGVALGVLFAYYGTDAGRHALEGLMALKERYGSVYSFLVGAIFAGLVPRLVMLATGAHRGPLGPELGFGMALWGYRGVEVDWFYRLQGWLFGNDHAWQTVLCKTLVDQGLYSVFWVVPSLSVLYAWKASGWSPARTRRRIDATFVRLELPSAMIANAMVWTPTVVVVYLLPPALQLPVSNLVATFWVLMLVLLLGREADDETVDKEAMT